MLLSVMRKLILTLSILFLGGCSLVRDLARPFLGKTDSVPVVAPTFTLSGPAARLQDSLRTRLDWIATQPLLKSVTLVRLAFRNRPDSSVDLLATVEDGRRINSHGLDREGARALEADRIGKDRPLQAIVRSSGIELPLVVRALFTRKDYMFQNSKSVEDSVDVLLDGTDRKSAD